MFKALELMAPRVYDRILITEFVNLTTRGGRIDHSNGKHDDQVISLLLACYLIFFGKNLHLYGIDSSEVLSTVSATGVHIDAKTRNDQLAIRRRVSELKELISTDPVLPLKQSYERELNVLTPLLDDKIVAVRPLAITQVNYQENKLNNASTAEARLQAFARRFLRS